MGALPPNYNLAALGAIGALGGLHSARSAMLGGLAAAAQNTPHSAASAALLGTSQAQSYTESWIYVRQRFKGFLSSIALTDAQLEDGNGKIRRVVKCLNQNYYSSDSETDNYLLGGSWGKSTRVRPPRDIDLIYVLPYEVYQRYLQRTGNIQSQLLQEVKGVLEATFPATNMRGDGQVVMVQFNSFMVEVVPAIRLQNGQYWICDTNGGGRYKVIDPVLENKSFDEASKNSNRNVRDLVRMLKAWQEYCGVPIRSFVLERLVMEFLDQWAYKGNDEFWYDWMVRDFFAYMLRRENGTFVMPGTGEVVAIGNEWKSRAITAQRNAEAACEYDKLNLDAFATTEWQKIFGTDIGRQS